MIEELKKMLNRIDNDVVYLEENDEAWSKLYTNLYRQRRVLKKAIRKLEKLEAKKDELLGV
jgi:hypothetical protein